MKIISAIILCFILFALAGQNNSSIVGNWTIVSMNRDGIYYNYKKDSISFSEEFLKLSKNIVSDTLQKSFISENAKHIASQFRFEFYPDNKFKFVLDSISFVVVGNYKNMPLEKVIIFSNNRSIGLNGFDMYEKIKYQIMNGLLYLSMDNEDNEYEFVLKKKVNN